VWPAGEGGLSRRGEPAGSVWAAGASGDDLLEPISATSFERLQELLHDLFQMDVSQGTLNNVLKRGYEKLAVFEEQVKERIRDSEVVHFDETGMRVVKDLNWLHVASTPELTAYHIDAQRGQPAMAAMGFAGLCGHGGTR